MLRRMILPNLSRKRMKIIDAIFSPFIRFKIFRNFIF
jgi:hypothetical protein